MYRLFIPLYFAYGLGFVTIMLRAVSCEAFRQAPWKDRLGFLFANTVIGIVWPLALLSPGGRICLIATLTGSWGWTDNEDFGRRA